MLSDYHKLLWVSTDFYYILMYFWMACLKLTYIAKKRLEQAYASHWEGGNWITKPAGLRL